MRYAVGQRNWQAAPAAAARGIGLLTTSVSLLHRLRRGADPRDWHRFVRLYTPLLLDWARRAGAQDADATDLVQDVQLVLVNKLHAFNRHPELPELAAGRSPQPVAGHAALPVSPPRPRRAVP